MMQVAWQVPNDPGWIGGLNYYINLASAIFSLPERKIEPVLLGTAKGLPAPLAQCRVLPYPQSPRGGIKRLMDSVQHRYLDNGGNFARYLKKNGIRLLSHGQLLGNRSPVPAMCWIPDFQHVHLPEFFTPEECCQRDVSFKDIAARAQAIVLSSEAAREDFVRLFPEKVHKTHVLRFVASPPTQNIPSLAEVKKKYSLHEPYFHVPNQLWAHKNHSVIVDALNILHQRGHCPLVVSTGQTSDRRNLNYFSDLMQKVTKLNLQARMLFLGLIPYQDVAALMQGAVAMINPSLFEGWSTTVEEAKSLGKRIILSNIPVHIEQNPERGLFFEPHNPEALADAISHTLAEYDSAAEHDQMQMAIQKLPERVQSFGRSYQDIVIKVAGDVSRKSIFEN